MENPTAEIFKNTVEQMRRNVSLCSVYNIFGMLYIFPFQLISI